MINSPEEWKNSLNTLQYVINNTYHAVTKSSPSKLLFGFEQRSHADHELARFTKALVGQDTDLEKDRDASRQAARNAIDSIRAYNKKYRDTRLKKATVYDVGDYVMIRKTKATPGESAKLRPKFVGPYAIKKILGNNRYVVQDIPGFNVTAKPLNTILSCDRLKPWIRCSPPDEPPSEN
nr:PREDICTED: uncharacterized protein LOC105679248 [Linepithema humile]